MSEYIYHPEVTGVPGYCRFCRQHTLDAERACTYGLYHEFVVVEVKQVQAKKRDARLCIKCGLHSKNPLSTGNGCDHVYEAPQ